MTEIFVGDPLQLLTTALTNTLTKFLSCRERAGFLGSVGMAGGVRFFSVIRVAAGCTVEARQG